MGFLFLPFSYIVLQKSTLALLLAFTSPKSSLRFAIFPVLVICNLYLLPVYTSYVTQSTFVAMVSGEALNGLPDYAEKLLLSEWSFEADGPSAEIERRKKADIQQNAKTKTRPLVDQQKTPRLKKTDRSGTVWERLKFGVWVATSARYIASPYQARNVPPYSTSNPKYIPTRATFLLWKAFIFGISWLIIEIVGQANQPAKNPILFADKYIPLLTRFDEVTVKELITRIATTLFFWIAGYLIVQAYFSFWAFLVVAFGFDRPEWWRPMFGSLSECYTIRGFWGLFWHQCLRKKLTKTARYITFKILFLPRPSSITSRPLKLLSRYTEIFFVFLISGVLHQAMDVAQGLKWADSGSTETFCLMALGIMIEDGVQWAFRWSTGCTAKGAWWARVVGFAWVVFYLSYATPIWIYPSLSRNTGSKKDEILPFSILRILNIIQ